MGNVTRPMLELAPGERVITADPHRYGSEGRDLRIWRVTGRDGRLVDLAAADGETIRVFAETRQQFFDGDELTSDGTSIKWRSGVGRPRLAVVWTDRLPATDDGTALAYAGTLMAVSERNRESAIVLHVAGVEGNLARADLCFYASETEGRRQGDPDEFGEGFSGEIVGNAAFWSRRLDVELPEGFGAAPGDLVVAPRFRSAHAEGQDVLSLEAPVRLGSFPDRASVGTFLPHSACGSADGFGWKGFGVATDSDVAHEIDVGLARSQPDEALVLVTACTWREGETVANCLGHTGHTFMMADSVDDYLHGCGLEHGLWVAKDAKWWAYTSHEGEHDSGIDMDFVPATAEDVERFGFTAETLDAEIAELAEVDREPGLGERAMADARAASEAEAERAVSPSP